MRVWFSGRTRPCQGRDSGSIPGTRTEEQCTRSEMDIMPAFEAVVGGSNPSGCTKYEVFWGFEARLRYF
jgi:hypothetical protein